MSQNLLLVYPCPQNSTTEVKLNYKLTNKMCKSNNNQLSHFGLSWRNNQCVDLIKNNLSKFTDEILDILKCTICIRPFCQDLFTKQVCNVLKFAIEDLCYEKLQLVYLSVKSLSQLMCPKEFLNMAVDTGMFYKQR